MGGALNLFQQRGAQPSTPSRYKPIWTDRFYQGYYTNRNPMRSPLSVYYAEGWGLGKTDVLIDGANIELSIRLTLIRRPGFLYWSTVTLPYDVTGFFSYRQINPSLTNPVTIITDTTNGPYKLTPTAASAIFTKSAGAGVTRCLALANTVYMADGVDLLAWQDGGVAPNPRNWGISIGEFSGPSGPNDCGTGADVPVAGGVAWTNPGHIADGTPGTYATCTVGSVSITSQGPSTPVTLAGLGTSLPVSFTIPLGGDSAALTATNLGFNVPLGSTILGVVVNDTRQQTGGAGTLTTNIQLTGVTSSTKVGGNWTGSAVPETFGASNDLWGAALTPSVINSSTFGVSLFVHAPSPPLSNAGTFSALTITVYYKTPATNMSDYLEASNFGFSVASPTTIQGVVVTLKGLQSTTTPGSLSVQLMKAGSPVGAPKTGIQMPLTDGTITLGAAGDLWGTTLLAGDVADTGFGVAIQALNSSGTSQTWSMDDVQMTIYATGGPPISVSGSSGTFSATVGYKYVAAYGNSNSGHVSSTTPASASTGIFTNKLDVGITLTASTDPQVNQIWVFRTTDGGANYYNLPNSPFPNASGTVTDSADDGALNILLPAPINSANNPPPAGATIPVYHMGRVWVAVRNVLYASDGPDTITGNGAEAFPPANYWVLQSPITRMYPTASGLVIFCTDRVQFLPNPTTNSIPYFNPQPLVDGLGLLSYDALDIYGSQAYMYTADNQFVSFDLSSGITEIGFPIEDQIQGLNPMAVSAAYHTTGTDRGLFLCTGAGHWWRCVPQQPPDFSLTGPVWSPMGGITNGTITLMKSLPTSDGVRQLLCANGGNVIYRDSSFSTFSDLGSAYEAYGTIGSIVLANPGQLAELGFITADFARRGTSPAMYVLMDETTGTFSQLPDSISDPPNLYGIFGAPLSLYSNRYYFKQSAASGAAPQPAFCRHMQIKFDFGADMVQNEMLSNTIWGSILEEDSV